MVERLERNGGSTPTWCGCTWDALLDRRCDAFDQAIALQGATDEDAVEVVSRFLAFFEATGVQLLRDEEEWIFRTLRPTPAAVIQAFEEHIAIGSLVGSLVNEAGAGCVDLRLVHSLGVLLESHLLNEEEEVRPLVAEPPRMTLAH